MRTTLNLDSDVFAVAKEIAEANRQPLGKVVSRLMRRGYERPLKYTLRNGIPVIQTTPGAKPISPEDVKKELEDGW